MPVAYDAGVHQAAQVLHILALQHLAQADRKTAIGNVGDEAQPALIDANQRHTIGRQLSANAQHRAIAAHHQTKVTLLTDLIHRQLLIPGQPHIECSVVFQDHLAALVVQEVSDCLDGAARVCNRGSCGQGLVLADKGHKLEFGVHFQITSLK